MKRSIIGCIIGCIGCLLLAACGGTRKSVSATSSLSLYQSELEVTKHEAERVIDTTQTEWGRTTITEIEFFPSTDGGEHTDIDFPEDSEVPYGSIGGIKKLRRTVIESETEAKGISYYSDKVDTERSADVYATSEETFDETREPPPSLGWKAVTYFICGSIGLLVLLTPVIFLLKGKGLFRKN